MACSSPHNLEGSAGRSHESILNTASLPAPEPEPPSIKRANASLSSAAGLQQYMQRVVSALHQHNTHQARLIEAASPSAGPAPKSLLEGGPEVAQASLAGFTTTRAEAGTTTGSGILNLFAQNGTLLAQRPYEAPLVPKSFLQQRLDLLKLNAAGAAAVEYENGTTPTVTIQLFCAPSFPQESCHRPSTCLAVLVFPLAILPTLELKDMMHWARKRFSKQPSSSTGSRDWSTG